MKRCWIPAGAGALLFVVAGMIPLMAEEVPSSKLVGSVNLVSDYLFRGISQTNRKPAAQAGLEYDHASGWYVGAWGSNVSWLSDASTPTEHVSNSLELDAYGGYRGSFATDWSYDVGLYEYYYPGSYPSGSGYTRPYTTEGYASLGWKGVSLKYSYSFTNLFGSADSKHSGYVDLSWNYEVSPGWLINSHVGHQDVVHTHGASYSDWKLGVTRNFDSGYSVALGYYDTNAKKLTYTNADGHYLGRAIAVLTLGKSF